MKAHATLVKTLGIVLVILGAVYLALPIPKFPPPPPGALTSLEPADTESVYRVAYYTDLTRPEIEDYYDRVYHSPVQYRINLPPEDAYTVIRDQTRSSYLEEIVHPLRDSLYINVFVPTLPTEQINRNGIHYLDKITIRQIPSQPITRLTILLMISVVTFLLMHEYVEI
jgi:hypothetical protein